MQGTFLAAAVLASLLFAVSVAIDNEVREDVVPYMPTLVVVNGVVGLALLPVGFGTLTPSRRPASSARSGFRPVRSSSPGSSPPASCTPWPSGRTST